MLTLNLWTTLILNLVNNSYKPCRKPDDTPVYINVKSNHPPPIFKELPHSVNRRISALSNSHQTFNNAIPPYKDALSKAGYTLDAKFVETPRKENQNRHRKRNVIWFNPPYSKAVTTNVGKEFFKLLDRHIPKGSPLYRIFNRNTVKPSYSCMET